MPILRVEMIGPGPEGTGEGLAGRIAEAAASALGAPPGATWVRLLVVPREEYAEHGGGPPEGVQPVLVSVLLGEPPAGEDLAEQAARLTRAISRACGRPVENIHVVYEPPARGRIAFGGEIVR